MLKKELITMVAMKANIPYTTAYKIIDALFDKMTEVLANGERIYLKGFGVIKVKAYESYTTGCNPLTIKPIFIKPKNRIRFKTGKKLNQRLNLEE